MVHVENSVSLQLKGLRQRADLPFVDRRRGLTEVGDEGFTLIELLVVIIIIGILAAIAIPVFLNQRQKAWDSAAMSDLRHAAQAEENYLADTGSYGGIADVASKENLKVTNGTTIISIYVDPTKGYCLGAMQAGGSPLPSGESGLSALGLKSIVWWWDSGSGGLQSRNTPIDLQTSKLGCPQTNPVTDPNGINYNDFQSYPS